MKPVPCFEVNQQLVQAAHKAEQRKNRAIERLMEKLNIGGRDQFGQALRDLIDADKRALRERGQ
jgi:hypothetical protein